MTITPQEYGQSIHAGFLAATMGTLPITMLFLVTPLRWRALSLSVGFFVFVAIWGMIDIGLQVMIEGVANNAFEEVRRNNLAFNAFMLTPPASIKALSVFGASRLISITLASTAVVAIFRFSGASFAQLTGSFSRQGEQIGSEAADSRLNPARLAQETESRANAAGSLTALGATGKGGFAGIAQQATGRWLQNLSHHRAFAGAGNSAGLSTGDIYRASGATSGGGEARRVAGLARQSGYSEEELATAAGDTSATGAERGYLDAQTFETSANQLAAEVGVSSSAAKELIAGYGNTLAAGRAAGTGGDLGRVFKTGSQEKAQRIGGAEGIREAAERAGLSPEQISKAGSFLDTVYGAGSAKYQNSASETDFDNLQLGGELRHVRSAGEAEGVQEASSFTGKSGQELSGQAAALDASDRLIGNNRFANFAEAHGISTSDIQNARGANLSTAINARTREAFSDYLTPELSDIARPGGSFSMTFDPTTNEVGRFDVRSGSSGSQDDTVHVSDGLRVDARQGTDGGQTLFRYAELNEAGNLSGAAQFGRLIERSESEGSERVFEDSLSQQVSGHLSGISGKETSFLESDSEIGTNSVYAGVNGSTGFKLFGIGGTLDGGAKISQDFSDVDSTQLVNSYNYWNDQAREVYDNTIGNEDFAGDQVARSQAYFDGILDLREQAFEIKDWVSSKGHDDSQSEQKVEPTAEKENSTAGPTYNKWPSGFRSH